MADAPAPSSQWWFRAAGTEKVYGPVSPEVLLGWAREGRVYPEDKVSPDNSSWGDARGLPFLAMDTVIVRPDGRVLGPYHRDAVEALRKVGLFEPLLPLYGQDDNWCDRAAYHGYKIGYVTAARGIHDRAGRREPKDRLIYRIYYMGSLVRLLDIRRPLWERRLYVLLFTLVKTLKYGSLQPLKYHRSLRRQMKKVRAARETTRKPAAYV